MKKIITLLLLSLFINQKIKAQSYLPVPTTGYTLDAVAENTTAVLYTTGALDAGGNCFFSKAYGVIFSSIYGLPNNGVLSSATRTYQLQSYAGPNAFYLPTVNQVDSLTLVTPAAFTNLSLLGFASEADGTMSVTVRFTDNSTQVFSGITVYDWYNAATPFAGGFDRIARATGVLENVGAAGNPKMFAHDLTLLCANQSKQVKRIIIKNTSTTAKIIMWAVAGVSMPLTGSVAPAGICNSGTATLTAGGSTTFTWLPVGNFAGSTATSIPVSPTVTTVYTLQTISASSCTLNIPLTVNVYTAVPSLTIINTANAGGICPTKTINLTASGAVTYTWTGSAVTITNGVTFVPNAGGDYTVTGENTCGTNTAIASVSIHPLPTVIPATSASTLCSGGSVTLTATGNATNYVWSGGNAPSTNTGSGFVPINTTTYVVVGTSALSCTASATMPVTVFAVPSIPPTGSPTIVCFGNSTTLTAVGASNYTWTSATQTVFTSSLVATPSATGVSTYTISRTNSTCSDTRTISITTNPLPIILAIASPTSICALNVSSLSISGAQTYTWLSPGVPTTSFTGSSPVVYPQASTTYTGIASDGTCISTTTVFVAVDPMPTLSVTPSATAICKGGSVTMNITGGINYTWTATTGGVFTNTATIVDTPTSTAAYTIIGDNSFGCTSSIQQIVVVNALPSVSVAVNRTLVCTGGPSTLTASGATTYTWLANNALTNTTVVNPTSTTSGPVIYSVTGSFSTGCQSTKTVQVSIFIPTLTITGNTNTCEGGTVSLKAAGGNNNTYTWTTGTGGAPVINSNLTTTVNAAGIYTVNATAASGSLNCPGTQTVGVGIYFSPTITAVPQRSTICNKESVELYADGGLSYSWNNGMSGGTITVAPTTQTNYTVTGTDANGCVNTGTVQVKLSGCVGINEFSNVSNGLLIYPNPNNGEFTIQSGSEINLNLVNELGQLIRTFNLSETNNYRISVTDLAKGIYFLSGLKNNIQINQKIIVTK